jgi:hypothetical protein
MDPSPGRAIGSLDAPTKVCQFVFRNADIERANLGGGLAVLLTTPPFRSGLNAARIPSANSTAPPSREMPARVDSYGLLSLYYQNQQDRKPRPLPRRRVWAVR